MVDGEDLRAHARIEGAKMVHFIIELFECPLFAAVNAQRLLASIVLEHLRTVTSVPLRRDGDDIFSGNKKLSISIATASPVSSLIHFAVNVTNEGTPVETVSLENLGVNPSDFATVILEKFSSEMSSIRDATHKVRWVR
jgi:hypothetical protein